ncbi:MAG: CoA transferase [Enterobacteriaceae bacterium]
MLSQMSLHDSIHYALTHRLKTEQIDLSDKVNDILVNIGSSLTDFGGALTFYGKDPIIPSVLRYGSAAAIALASKSAQIASLWKMRTGESQDIHIDVRKALRRFSPFVDGMTETINGYPGNINSERETHLHNAFYRTRDNRWVFLAETYPMLRNSTLNLLNCDMEKESIARAIAQWDGEALEQAAEKAGVVIALVRSPQEFMQTDVFRQVIAPQPLISIRKIADSAPVPFTDECSAPLSGIKALGLAHVIAGPAIGRDLSLYGADVLNILRPQDVEPSLFHNTSHVGERSATLDLNQADALQQLHQLLQQADIFYANRRPGFLQRYHLDAETLSQRYPGLIHVTILFTGENGPWSQRVGFDVAAGAFCGPYYLESVREGEQLIQPVMTPVIGIVDDYITGWLATTGVLQALKRRAQEGGSYQVTVSLARVACWLMSLGVFSSDYAKEKANSDDEHRFVTPDPLTAMTPMGLYKGVEEQVQMSRTPGHFKHVLQPLGSSAPEWE